MSKPDVYRVWVCPDCGEQLDPPGHREYVKDGIAGHYHEIPEWHDAVCVKVPVDAVEAAERATGLAEAYGEAVAAVASALPVEPPVTMAAVNRIRAILAGVEREGVGDREGCEVGQDRPVLKRDREGGD